MNYTIKINDTEKEFTLVPRTRKVVALTESLKAKNLNELIFTGLADGNPKVLAEIIKAFAEDSDGKQIFTSINNVYDFIDDWKAATGNTLEDLYKDVAKVVNEMGFFKKKMTEEELNQQINQPMLNIDLKEIISNSVQKSIDEIAQEEFKGYRG